MENWKTVFDGAYEVSDLGNVRRAIPGVSTFIGRPVLPNFSPGGYLQVAFSAYGKTKRIYIHHLVMLAFVGERPKGYIVNHKDLNRTNNNLNNLEYITQKENCLHSFKTQGRKRGPSKPPRELKGKQVGEKHWMKRNPEKILHGEELNSKLTADQVLAIREKRASGVSCKDLVSEYKISIAQVSRICLRKRWAHI